MLTSPGNPMRPRTLTDMVSHLIQQQDNAQDPPGTALYLAVYVPESVGIADSVSLGELHVFEVVVLADAASTLLHDDLYYYDASDARFDLGTYS